MNSICKMCNICTKNLPVIVECSKKLSKQKVIFTNQNIKYVNKYKIDKTFEYNRFQKTKLSLIDRKIQDMVI